MVDMTERDGVWLFYLIYIVVHDLLTQDAIPQFELWFTNNRSPQKEKVEMAVDVAAAAAWFEQVYLV